MLEERETLRLDAQAARLPGIATLLVVLLLSLAAGTAHAYDYNAFLSSGEGSWLLDDPTYSGSFGALGGNLDGTWSFTPDDTYWPSQSSGERFDYIWDNFFSANYDSTPGSECWTGVFDATTNPPEGPTFLYDTTDPGGIIGGWLEITIVVNDGNGNGVLEQIEKEAYHSFDAVLTADPRLGTDTFDNDCADGIIRDGNFTFVAPPDTQSNFLAITEFDIVTCTSLYVPDIYPTIQDAYNSAIAGDEIVVEPGTYNEHDIVVTSGVSLRSETGDPADVIIDAQDLGRGFTVSSAASGTEIVGVTITNGCDNTAMPDSKGGGVYCSACTLELRDCIISGCTAEGSANLGGYGGGIYAVNSTLTLVDCEILENEATYTAFGGDGGGLYVDGGSVEATGCLFDANTAAMYGGAACSANSSDDTFTNCVFTSNSATANNGGALAGGCLSRDLTGCVFSDNSAGTTGGAVAGLVSWAEGCTFNGNSAPQGGAVTLSSTGGFLGCTFYDNHATSGNGGAVWTLMSASYDFDNCTFSENSATGSGGAVCPDYTSAVTMQDCIVAFGTGGAGVGCAGSGTATLTCSDVYGNTGGDWVGCILEQQGSDHNFSLDPRFCGPVNPDEPYSLKDNSPCAAANNLDCGQVGAYPIGCEAFPTVYWDGGGDGVTWEDPYNWDPDRVPLPCDHAKIVVNGTYTITYNSTSTIYALTHGAASGIQTLDIQSGALAIADEGLNRSGVVVRGGAAFGSAVGGDTVAVVNGVGATFTLDNGDLTGTGLFINRGALFKTGSTMSRVTMVLENRLAARSDSGFVSVDAGTLSFEGDVTSHRSIRVNSGGTAIVSSHFQIPAGDVEIGRGGEFVVAAPGTLSTAGSFETWGQIVVDPGAVFSNVGDLIVHHGGSLVTGGLVTNDVDGYLLNEGVVQIAEAGFFANLGYLEHSENAILTGSGVLDNSVGSAAIKGLVAPGDQEGTFTFLGDFVQSSTSEISLEIGGYSQGSTYDLLAVTGSATLNGAIALTLTDGFEPAPDDSFQVITYAAPGPGGTEFDCQSGFLLSETLYVEPQLLPEELQLWVVAGTTGNADPVAAADYPSVTGNEPVTIDVLANDFDPDVDDLRIILLGTETLGGIAYINGGDLLVTYAAAPGFAGADSFRYVVTDCYGGADTEWVRINVGEPHSVWSVPGDSPTVAGALALASPGDTVLVACGVYHEADLVVPQGVTLASETGDPDCVLIDGSGRAGRMLSVVDADTSTAVIGLSVAGGGGVELGGGLYCLRSSPRVVDCSFVGNSAVRGGGVACDEGSTPAFIGCRMESNSAIAGGGICCNDGSSASFSGCTIDGNVASESGGGVLCDSLSSPAFTSCTFVGNSAPLGGGSGVRVDHGASPVFDRTILAFGVDGEAVACIGAGEATFTCSDIWGNDGGDWDGCIDGQVGFDGNFSLDPWFCDSAQGDYHLVPGSPCADAAGCGLVGASGAGCLPPPDIDVSPSSFTFELAPGETTSDVLEITNMGREELTWLIRENGEGAGSSRRQRGAKEAGVRARGMVTRSAETAKPMVAHVKVGKGGIDPRPGRAPSRGGGGPDAFGYTWSDSGEPSGPSYAWREIAGVGVALSLTDDGFAEVVLPFPFPFYCEQKTAVRIGSNGYLTFGDNAGDFSNDPIPDPWDPNDLVAPFWCDLNPELGGDVYHYYDAVEEEFIVQYDDLYDYFGGGPYTFEVILELSGAIVFQYEEVPGSHEVCTVGIERSSGTEGLEVVYNATYVQSGMAVRIEDPAPWLVEDEPSGVIAALDTEGILLDVDTYGVAQGVYSITLIVESDDPDEPEIAIPVTLGVGVTGVESDVPAEYGLRGNCPNPFHPSTEISYDLPVTGKVSLRIYSVSGRLLRVLLDNAVRKAGSHTVRWDGRDRNGAQLPSGVYVYALEVPGRVFRRRMVLLK